MRPSFLTGTVVCTLLSTLCSALLPSSPLSLESFIQHEKVIAKQKLLANIGASGSKAPEALPGIVVASPSMENPDYFFFWLRDGSLVFKYLIDEYVSGRDRSLLPHIEDFIGAQKVLQEFDNLSGSVESTLNLGDPKFNINETAFLEPWGRPQRDGPALRITALSTFANHLLDTHQSSQVVNSIWPIIQKDANYLANEWNLSTFDLWEELDGRSFFTSAVQHRSLREAISLGTRVGKGSTVTSWKGQAANILCLMQSYWNPTSSFMTANVNSVGAPIRSGIDANTVLASIHTFDPSAGCDSTTFQPCSDKALANLHIYVDSFRSVYAINNGTAENRAPATGRYQEDVYFDGNPWYLTTLAVSEQLHLATYTWQRQKSITITSLSLPFFQTLLPSIKPGTYHFPFPTFLSIITSVQTFADEFISVVQKHTPSSGSLSEQFSKVNGSQVSAADLTWSYASALTAFNARAGLVSNEWGGKGLTVPSGGCQSNPGPSVVVMFNVEANTTLGENIFLTGSVDALQNWSPDIALPLTTSTETYPIWTINVTLPAFTPVEYKYIRKETDGSVIWESDPNMRLTTPGPQSEAFVENDVWR